MPQKQTKPKAHKALRRGAAKRAKPGTLRANLAFGLLTVFILAAGGTSAAWAASRITNPSGQQDSFAALPVYNVIGQRTDRLEFWPRARYHDVARSSGSQEVFSAQLALETTGFQELLLNLMVNCAPVYSLTSSDDSEVACYTYYAGNLICRFYDDVPVVLLCDAYSDYPIYRGVLNASIGRGNGTDQLCYTALITPDASMTPATEEQYQQAYQTILEHLMMLARDTGSAPYYSCGPLTSALYVFIDQFPRAAEASDGIGGAFTGEDISETGTSSVMNTLNLFEQWFIQDTSEYDVPSWEALGMPEPDRSNPEEVERFLQEFFRTVYLIDLQILRQDNCYLILFQTDTNVLGFYYDPLLQTYTGFGIQ